MVHIVLASASPRRSELLSSICPDFTVVSMDIDETPSKNTPVENIALEVARKKMETAIATVECFDVLITADTVVIDVDQPLGKPSSREEAIHTLTSLRGKSHKVITAVVVASRVNLNQDVEVDEIVSVSEVVMRNYSDTAIHEFVGRGEADDKAGAYAIQDAEFSPVQELQGCECSVMGLPVNQLHDSLSRLSISGLELSNPGDTRSRCGECPFV